MRRITGYAQMGTVFFVRPRGDRWVFGRGDKADFVFNSERRAIEFALTIIRYSVDSELLIRDANGHFVKRLPGSND